MDLSENRVYYSTSGRQYGLKEFKQKYSDEFWLFDNMDDAIESAGVSQQKLMEMSIKTRKRIIEYMRDAGRKNAAMLAELAHTETGFGRTEHKVLKNILVSDNTPGVEDVESFCWTGDYGITVVERAPFGVIGSIIPSTNPTSSVINNSISMIAAGNAVVFNPHPSAVKCSIEAMRVLNAAILEAGGPPALICTVKNPSMESSNVLMNHKDIALLSVTGGEAVVKIAMSTGKKCIAAGPGNPPVIVDDTVDIRKTAKDIISGASFDNNILCICEKEIIAFDNIADGLMEEMVVQGCKKISGAEIDKVVNTVLIKQENGSYVINRKYVGHDASVILEDSGIDYIGDPALIIAEVPFEHPFIQVEMMMPVLGITRAKDINDAVRKAVLAEHGCKHSAMIHSHDVRHMTLAARALNTTIFVKNAPSYAGNGFEGEGFTTFTIATPTGEGLTSARTFTRMRRCTLHGSLNII